MQLSGGNKPGLAWPKHHFLNFYRTRNTRLEAALTWASLPFYPPWSSNQSSPNLNSDLLDSLRSRSQSEAVCECCLAKAVHRLQNLGQFQTCVPLFNSERVGFQHWRCFYIHSPQWIKNIGLSNPPGGNTSARYSAKIFDLASFIMYIIYWHLYQLRTYTVYIHSWSKF